MSFGRSLGSRATNRSAGSLPASQWRGARRVQLLARLPLTLGVLGDSTGNVPGLGILACPAHMERRC